MKPRLSTNERTARDLRKMAEVWARKRVRSMADCSDRDNGEYILRLLDGVDLAALASTARSYGYLWTGAYTR